MKPVSRHMDARQRAEISASKRFDKNTQAEEWKEWVEYYLRFLEHEALPAQGIGQYIRIRPKHLKDLELPERAG